VFIALTLTNITFKFDPSIVPMHRTIHDSWDTLVNDYRRQLNEGCLPSELFLQDDEFESAWSRLVEKPISSVRRAFVYRSSASNRWYALPSIRSLASVALVGAISVFTILAAVSIVAFNKRSDRSPSVETQVVNKPAEQQNIASVEAPQVNTEEATAQEPTETPEVSKEICPHVDYQAKIRPSFARKTTETASFSGVNQTSNNPPVSNAPAAPKIENVNSQSAAQQAEPKTIMVLVQVQDGLAAKAFVPNHQAEMEAYESAALRQARQRNYPNTGDGGWESLLIKVEHPDKQ
jgi:hypothetical protein